MCASFEQYFIDRFYGRVYFIPAFTQELFFGKTFPFGGFFRGFTNLTLVNCIYIFFFLRDIVLENFYCIYTDLYYYCVEWIERKGGGTVCPYLGSDSVKRSGRVCLS